MRAHSYTLLIALAALAAPCTAASDVAAAPSAPLRPCPLRRGSRFAKRLLQPNKLLRARRPADAAAAVEGGSCPPLSSPNAPAVASPPGSVRWAIFACWAYFLSVALTAPAMPALCNSIANADGSTKVSAAGIDLKGTLESVDQLMTFLLDPLWGAVSDHVGRKPLQLLACAGITLGWGTAALSRSVPLLVGGRALDGVTSCMLPICQSAVKDATPPQQLVARLGLLQGVAVGAAFIIGGMAGGILTKARSPREVFALASATALLAGVAIAAFAPETLAPARRAPRVAWARANPLAAIARLGGSRTTLGASAAFLLFWLGLNGLQVNLYNYAAFKYGWDASTAVGLQAGSGMVLALSNVLGPQLLAPRIGDVGVIRAGMVGFALCLLAMGLSATGGAFAAAVLCGSVATMCLPGLTGLIAQQAAPGQAGAMLTALDSVSTLDRLLAYKLMSRLFAWGLEHGRPSVHFFVGAACVLGGWLCFEAMLRVGAVEAKAPRAAGEARNKGRPERP